MSIYEPMKKCENCGSTISTFEVYCTNCGAKQNDVGRAARISEEAASKWFSQAGSLDDSLDSSYTPYRPAPVVSESAPVVKPPVASPTAAPAGATFIKPVKGLKDTPATPVRREPEPVVPVAVEPIGTDPAPVIPVAPVKEEPRCKECGAVVPKGTTLCWRCSTSATIADKTVAKKEKPDVGAAIGSFFAKNKKAIMIGAAACLVLVVIIMLFSMGGPLNESEIIAVLPESITSIYIDDELVPLRVDSLKIDKRKTQDGMDDVYCVIELSSDSLAVTKYQQLTFAKYNGNEWIMDWYAPYATEEVRVLKATDELYDWAIGRIEYSDDRYANIESYITNYDVTVVSDREITYVFDISKTIGLMSITGQITFEGTLDGDEYEGYSWYGWPDDSAVQISWDVDGTWNGGMSNWGMGWYELTMNILSLNTEAITCTWSYDQDGDDHTGDGSDCWIIDSNDEMIEFGVGYGTALTSYIKVTFYIDGTCVASVPFLGDFYMELQ